MEQQKITYGEVRITKGHHKGKIGIYDEDVENKAVVYFDLPFLDKFAKLPHKYLKPIQKNRAHQ